MDDTIRNLIDSPNPDDRRHAIKLLAKQGDGEALKVLAVLFKTDTDPEIRELAVKAGKYIKKQQEESKWAGSARAVAPRVEEEPEEAQERVHVSSMSEERAKALLDQAMDLSIRREKTKAMDLLRKAFKINPNLRYDSYAMSMASDITGMGRDETLDLVMGEGGIPGEEKAKRKSKNDEAGEDATVGEAVTELLIYTLVTATVFIVGILLCFQAIAQPLGRIADEMVRTMPPPDSYQYESALESLQTFNALNAFVTGGGIVTSIILGLIVAVYSLIMLLLSYFCIHVAATMLFGGTGSFTSLIRKVTMFQTILSAVGGIIMFGVFILVLNSLVNGMTDPTAYQNTGSYEYTSSTDAALAGITGTLCAIVGVFGLISLGISYYYSMLIGQVYEFGTGKGCITLLASGVLLSIVNTLLQGVLNSAFENIVTSAMTR